MNFYSSTLPLFSLTLFNLSVSSFHSLSQILLSLYTSFLTLLPSLLFSSSPSFPLFLCSGEGFILKRLCLNMHLVCSRMTPFFPPFSSSSMPRRKRINGADAVKDRKGLLICHSDRICGHYFHFY